MTATSTLYGELSELIESLSSGYPRERTVGVARCLERVARIGRGRRAVTLIQRTFPDKPRADVVYLKLPGKPDILVPADLNFQGMEGIERHAEVEKFLREHGRR